MVLVAVVVVVLLVPHMQEQVLVVGEMEVNQTALVNPLPQTLAVVVVELLWITQVLIQAVLVVQVTHELLIGVNYGTTLRIS
jgi:hypothetical protein